MHCALYVLLCSKCYIHVHVVCCTLLAISIHVHLLAIYVLYIHVIVIDAHFTDIFLGLAQKNGRDSILA